jgi:hypothetical protein
MSFKDFHVVLKKAESDRIAELLKRDGVRIEQRVINEIGRPEYVIAVHSDDVGRAGDAFWKDVGDDCRTFRSGEKPAGAYTEGRRKPSFFLLTVYFLFCAAGIIFLLTLILPWIVR